MRLGISLAPLVGFFALAGAMNAADAANAPGSFTVSMTIVSSCVVNSAGNMSFGTNQGIITAPIDTTSTIAVTCSTLTPYNIGLNVPVTETTAARVMTGPGGATVNYALYHDFTHLLLWGQTILTDTAVGVGTGASQSYTVYGEVPVQNTPAAGTYTENVVVAVTY